MAPVALTSDFIPASQLPSCRSPHLRRTRPSPSPAVVFAQLNPPPFPSFSLGGKKEDKLAPEGDTGKAGGSSGFFDLSRVADVKSLVPVSGSSPFRRKDPRTVFVAGATGQAGVRIAQSLLRQGFSVRAGVPVISAAQELARLAVQYKLISVQESKNLNAVQSDFQDPALIAKAIGSAGKVVVTVGPAENGPSTPVTIADAIKIVIAASLAGVEHLTVVYDPAGESPSSTYNVIDGIVTFFSTIFSKLQPLTLSDLIQKIVETDLRYTVLKAPLADDFSDKYSANLLVSAEGAAGSEYKVSKSQIATLVAGVFSDTSVTENKVVQVSTSPLPTKPIKDLFSDIPEDDRRKLYAEAQAKAQAEELAAKAEERALLTEAAASSKTSKRKVEEEVKKPSKQEAQEEEPRVTVESFFNKAKDLSGDFSWDKFSSQITSSVSQKIDELPKPKIEIPKIQIASVRGEAKARKLAPKKAVVKQPAARPAPVFRAKPKPEVAKSKEARKVFGGIFQQETIYIDDV